MSSVTEGGSGCKVVGGGCGGGCVGGAGGGGEEAESTQHPQTCSLTITGLP